MKNIQAVENSKRRFYRQLFVTLTVAVVGFLAILILVCALSAGVKQEKVVQVSGQVVEVTEREDSFAILLDQEREYNVNAIVAGELDGEQLLALQGENLTLYILSDEVIGFSGAGYGFSEADGLKLIKDNYQISAIIIGVLFGVLLAFDIFALVKFLTSKKMVRADTFKLINTRFIPVSIIRKQYLKYPIPLLLMALVFLVPMIMFSDPIGVAFWVFFGIFLLCLVSGVVLCALLLPIIKKKEIEAFTRGLDMSLDNREESKRNQYVFDVGNNLPFKLEEKGLLFRSEFEADFIINTLTQDEEFSGEDLAKVRLDLIKEMNEHPKEMPLEEGALLEYSSLNLVTRAVFRNSNEPIKLYICSRLGESLPNLSNDIFLEFDHDLYYFLKKYDVKVDGLDRCIEKRSEYMEKYCKGKIRFLEVTDNGEQELFAENKKTNKKLLKAIKNI